MITKHYFNKSHMELPIMEKGGLFYVCYPDDPEFKLRECKTLAEATQWMMYTGVPQVAHREEEYDMKKVKKKEPFRLIVSGGRDFDDRTLLKGKIRHLTKKLKDFVIVVGGAEGADKLAQEWAFHNMRVYYLFHADWKKWGKKAGYVRNREMAKFGDALLAFWDGKSPGTKQMIELAKKYKLPTRVVRY